MEAVVVISLAIGGVLALMFGPGLAAFVSERRRMRGSRHSC
jgi:hypothetical protein